MPVGPGKPRSRSDDDQRRRVRGFNPYSIALRKRGSHSARPTPSVTPITAILDTSRSTYSFKVELIWLPMFSTHSTERIRRQPLGTFGMKIESRSEQSYCMCCYSKNTV